MRNNFRQSATYWASPVSDGMGGYSWDAPTALKVRWEDRQEQFANEFGEALVSKALVFTDVDIDTNGYLYLGTSVVTDPSTLSGAYKVRQFIKLPDLRQMINERKAYL